MIQRTSQLRCAWKNSVTFQRVRVGREPGHDRGAERREHTHAGPPRRASGVLPWLQQALSAEKGQVCGLQEGWGLRRWAGLRGIVVTSGNRPELKRERGAENSLGNHQQKKRERESEKERI